MKKIYLLTILSITSLNLYSQTDWAKHDGNPVMVPGPGEWEDIMVTPGSVIFHEGEFHMWYAGGFLPTLGGDFLIGHATSPDGINWEKNANNPVLDKGPLGDWDDHGVFEPTVLWVDTAFHMWYSGYSSQLPMHAIGHATSPDGINWTRDPNNPVLQSGSGGDWDASGIIGPCVIYDGKEYHMYYSGHHSSIGGIHIGHATSPDGIHWTKDAQNPVLRPGSNSNWDNDQLYYPTVLYNAEISTFYLWYAGGKVTSWQLGAAYSGDGSNWTTYKENPVVSRGKAGSWDAQYISISSVLLDDSDSLYKMWYHAGASDGSRGIGYAQSVINDRSERVLSEQIRIYPNPAADLLNVRAMNDGRYAIEMSSLNGQLIHRTDFRGASCMLDLSSYPSGIYVITIRAEDFVTKRKIVKH